MPDPQPRRSAAHRRRTRVAGALVLATLIVEAAAQEAVRTSLADLSLEELSNIEITSVSRRAQRLSDAAASIFVITGDEIRRAGATSLPEALRLAPNLNVVRVSTYGYTVSARGFTSSSGNKLLVLIDGRSVYTPLFSGVFWDVQDVMLEDIERIEVISGPGSTLWGVNAVNGVINIITRSARDTQGGLVAAGGGNQDRQGAVRWGGTAGDIAYRIYAKHSDRDDSETAAGIVKDDDLRHGQVGFRADWTTAAGDRFSAHGNAYRANEGQPPPGMIVTGAPIPLDRISLSGANLLALWTRPLSGGGELQVQAYYDRTERVVRPQFSETLDIVDVQVQHASRPFASHAVVWGAQYRTSRDRVDNSEFIAFLPARTTQQWTSLFAQDEIALRDDLHLTLGARLERNDYTGNEFLPTGRLAWKVADDHLLWGAATRTVRAPARLDRDSFVPGNPPFLLVGGPDVRSEVAKVYAIGYRGRPSARTSLSATVFKADYDHLRTQEVRLVPLQVFFASGMEGETSGIELWGTFEATPRWRLSAGYTNLDVRLRLKPGSNDTAGLAVEGHDPEHRALLRSSLDLPHGIEFDATVRHVSALSNPDVPAYTAFDARIGWSPRRDLELSIHAQNLFDSHGEFTGIATRSEWGRIVFFKVLARF